MALLGNDTATVVNTAPSVLTYPFTFGMWIYPQSASLFQTIFLICDSSIVQFFAFAYSDANTYFFNVADPVENSISIGSATTGNWQYILCRGISATNRRLAVIQANGATVHGQNTVSSTPICTQHQFGINGGGFVGRIAEWFITNTDIQPNGAQLADITLRHLAYNGPFSMPYIAKDIVEYRSFFSTIGSGNDEPDEVFWGSRGRQVWTTTGAPTVGPHVPLLLPTYRRPIDYHRMMMI